jgi:hypothetical protein
VKRVKSGWGRRKNKRFTEKSEAKKRRRGATALYL